MASLAARTPPSVASAPAAAAARRACARSPASRASAASHAAAVIASTSASRSASLCLTPWNCPMGRPNCTRVRACSAATSRHHPRSPASSAAAITSARSRTSSPSTPARTRSGGTTTASRTTSADRRVGSRHGRAATVIPGAGPPPGAARWTAHQVASPSSMRTGSSARCASPAPSTAGHSPDTASPPSPATLPSGGRAPGAPRATQAGVEPSTIAGTSALASVGSAWRDSTAAARTVGRYGPGASVRPSSSATTASSNIPNPWPPSSSATCTPSQPCAARSAQIGGSTSSGRSSMARGTSLGQWRSAQRRTPRRSSSCSSLTPMGIGPPWPHRCLAREQVLVQRGCRIDLRRESPVHRVGPPGGRCRGNVRSRLTSWSTGHSRRSGRILGPAARPVRPSVAGEACRPLPARPPPRRRDRDRGAGSRGC